VRELLTEGEQDRAESPAAAPTSNALSVRGARARYGADGRWALDGVDLELVPGRRVAVVGPSGAGKSTLAALLVRLLDPEHGEVVLGDVPLADLPAGELRRRVVLCEQDAHVFDASIAENLRIGREDASQRELLQVVAHVGLDAWLSQLSDGLDTELGEHGCRLSGGQRKRLVVARALLAGAPVVVLDEPTEHLDVAAAADLMARLVEPREDRTTLVVTHRLAGLEDVDEILVMVAGRVVERGNHAELVDRDGTYTRLWERELGDLARARPA
jgi:ABC-type multidrug transport system fused ATPase/permease subunit